MGRAFSASSPASLNANSTVSDVTGTGVAVVAGVDVNVGMGINVSVAGRVGIGVQADWVSANAVWMTIWDGVHPQVRIVMVMNNANFFTDAASQLKSSNQSISSMATFAT